MNNSDILPAARAEYHEAFDWYSERSAPAASRFAAEVESAIDQICQHPLRFARWDEVYRYYKLHRFPYFVAYRQTADSVVIVAIRHASRDQDAWIGR
ncbi:MAG: type II toxin-antitoxin system RelE/ParE family toxin [Pirellulales bacterium]